MAEPIMVPCEGAGAHGHPTIARGVALCPMCGQLSRTIGSVLPEHERMDVIAMIERGDDFT